MSQPHRQTAARISEELDIHVITLYRWRKTWRLHGEVPVAAPTPPREQRGAGGEPVDHRGGVRRSCQSQKQALLHTSSGYPRILEVEIEAWNYYLIWTKGQLPKRTFSA